MKLNDSQSKLLIQVADADQNLRASKIAVQARTKAYQENLLATDLDALDRAVRAAFEGGVPSTQIGQQGLGTKSPSAVKESLARTAGSVRVQKEIAEVVRVSQLRDEAAA